MREADDDGADAADPLLAAVAGRIVALYEAKGWKPADFAREAGTTLQNLWRLRAGRANLTLRSLVRIAAALDVTVASLINEAGGRRLASARW